MVVDLDPGPGAGLDECAAVARLVAGRLRGDGLEQVVPVTSGSKGLQLYAHLPRNRTAAAVHAYARDLAQALAAEHPDMIVSSQKRSLHPGKVLLDWSQNHPAKTTITPYSLRGRDVPQAAAPRHWEEITSGLTQLGPQAVLDRLAHDGDLMT